MAVPSYVPLQKDSVLKSLSPSHTQLPSAAISLPPIHKYAPPPPSAATVSEAFNPALPIAEKIAFCSSTDSISTSLPFLETAISAAPVHVAPTLIIS